MSNTKEQERKSWPWLALLVLSIFLAFAPASLGIYPMKFDIMDQFYPCRAFLAERFAAGEVPLWAPYIHFGYPFYSDPQAGLHYPIVWLLALIFGYSAYTMHLEFLLHVCLLGLSFFGLLRSLGKSRETAFLGALTWALSGFVLSNAQHLTWLISAAWLSTAVWALQELFRTRRMFWAFVFGAALGLSITGGYPAFAIIAFYCFLPYIAWRFYHVVCEQKRRVLALFSLAAFVALSLSWAYLYSLYEVMPFVARSTGLSAEQVNINAFPPRALLSLVAPWATGIESGFWGTDISMSNIYLGFLALPLFFFSWRLALARGYALLFAAGLLCLFLAFGEATPLRTWFYYSLPGMKFFKMASIFRVFASFFFLLYLSAVFEKLIQDTEQRHRFLRSFLLIIPLYLLGLFVLWQFVDFPTPVWRRLWLQVFYSSAALGGLAVLAYTFRDKPWQSKLFLLFVCGDLLLAASLQGPSTVYDRDVSLRSLQASIDKLKAEREPLPSKPLSQYNSGGDGSTVPIWHNLSFFRAQPAPNGFNNYHLAKSDSIEFALYDKPFVHALDSGIQVELKSFAPQAFSASVQAEQAGRIRLLQMDMPGWKIHNAQGQALPRAAQGGPFIDIAVDTAAQEIHWHYEHKRARWGFWLTVAAAFATILGLLATKNQFTF